MKIRILGCGSSVGVPIIGCKCEVCLSKDLKNIRTRSSIYVEYKDTCLVVDTSPDFRFQMLESKIERIDGVFYTHEHADHINGITDVRLYNEIIDAPIPAYADRKTMDYLKNSFAYVFKDVIPGNGWYKTWLLENILEYNDEFQFKDIKVKAFELGHGKISVLGFRFNDVVYTTDVDYISDEAFSIIDGAKLWILDCLRFDKSVSHANYEQVMEWLKRVNVERVVLTHMAHDFDYHKLKAILPANVEPAYDGMTLKVE